MSVQAMVARATEQAKPRWSGGQLILYNSVVGTVSKDAFDRGWWAYGCMSDWEDVELGSHSTEAKAKRAVEKWVRDNR